VTPTTYVYLALCVAMVVILPVSAGGLRRVTWRIEAPAPVRRTAPARRSVRRFGRHRAGRGPRARLRTVTAAAAGRAAAGRRIPAQRAAGSVGRPADHQRSSESTPIATNSSVR